MQRIKLFLSALIFGCVFIFDSAQSQIPDQEAIISYDANIDINPDNSINVTETIIYNTGPQKRHGIYRDIYPYSSQKRKMKIDNISVSDENLVPYQFSVSKKKQNIRIKIGDPNRTFNGQKAYIIKYHATKAVGQFQAYDEIYWNVTGNQWFIPIYETHVSVSLPRADSPAKTACFFGPMGSKNRCQQAIQNSKGAYEFDMPSTLNPQEGLTIAIGFPKGMFDPYTSPSWIELYWQWLVAIILPILTFVLSLSYWRKKGKDDKGNGVIIPQYDVCDQLSPIEVAGIIDEKINPKSLSAQIIYLAVKGYLKIEQLEKSVIKTFSSSDYRITKLKDFTSLDSDFDKKLLVGLFAATSNNSVTTSELKNDFYKTQPSIIKSALNSLLKKGYYKNLGIMKIRRDILFMMVTFIPYWIIVSIRDNIENSWILSAGMILSIIILAVFAYLSPAKTRKGVMAKEYLLGLKEYLQIAEKDRLEFHNAPESKPEVFEKLLPYAMVLGVLDIWTKEFEGIYNTPPSWYYVSASSGFNSISFGDSLINFSSSSSSSMSSGGSSGGGGGGGGGGGW